MSYTMDILKENSVLYLNEYDTDRICKFHIGKVCGLPGSSAICYEAKLYYSEDFYKPGTLKEFYPTALSELQDGDYCCHLERQHDFNSKKNLQLILCGDLSKDRFYEIRSDFLKAYEKISFAKQSNSDLWAAIPDFQIFRSFTEGSDCENYTIYIWTPYDIKIKTFYELLSDICADTKNNKNKIANLKMILESVKSLVERIKALHCSGIRHLDITPGNFGIQMTGDKPNGNISLFDINTIYSYHDKKRPMFLGTKGFRSPLMKEFDTAKLQKCDFFSIGACLYYALVMTENDKGDLVNCHFISPKDDDIENIELLNFKIKESFEKIDIALAVSPIFNNCDFTEDTEIRSKLATILKKCLSVNASEYKPYNRATEIVSDLEEVISIWNGIEGVESTKNAKKVASLSFQDKEYVAEKGVKLGAEGAIQWLLYEHPLYKCDKVTKSKKLNILTLGGGIYASKFIDIAFQLMQIDGFETEITVASNNADYDKSIFLAKRPGFKDFFNIISVSENGTDNKNSLGSIRFVTVEKFEPNNADNNEKIIKDICLKCNVENDYFSYIFVALHNDLLNYNVAKAAEKNLKCDNINFIVFGDKELDSPEPVLKSKRIEKESIHAVDINKTVDKSADYDFLRRMAFNVHLTWCGSLENLSESKRSFVEQYYSSSSFANALSIKYKLFSIGIEPNLKQPRLAAMQFKQKIEEDNCSVLKSLIMYEHRRWIAETISKGFTTLPESEFHVLLNKTKDDIQKKHPCLVSGDADWHLCDEYWKCSNRENWNKAGTDELDKLDELDRMSVRLHQYFVDLAHKRLNLIRHKVEELLDEILLIIKSYNADTAEFAAYRQSLLGLLCKDHIGKLNGDNLFKYYSGVFNSFLSNESNLSAKSQITNCIDKINDWIFPVVQSCRYVDWKLKDKDIIENIPFILTYNAYTKFIIPFNLNSINIQSDSAVALLTVNPVSVTFIIDDDVLRNVDSFIDYLKYILRIIGNHNLQTIVNIMVLQYIEADSSSNLSFVKIVRNISDRINHVSFKKVSENEANDCLDEFIYQEKDDVGQSVIINSSVCNNIIKLFKREDISVPVYTIDHNTHKLICEKDDIELSFIPFKSSLNVKDIYISANPKFTFEEPELESYYDFFWNKYINVIQKIEGKKVWKEFVEKLNRHSNNKFMSLDITDDRLTHDVNAFLPMEYKSALEQIISILIKEGLAENCLEGIIEHCMSSSIHIKIKTNEETAKKLKQLFGKPQYFLSEHEIYAIRHDKSIDFECENLFVSDISLTDEESNILELISEKGYLFGFNPADKNNVNFLFCSAPIKHLLVRENMILGLYIYYNAVASSLFDDIKIIKTTKDSNDFSIIATKDFKAFVINYDNKGSLNIEDMKIFSVPIDTVEIENDMDGTDLFIYSVNGADEQNNKNIIKSSLGRMFRDL